MIRSSSRAKSKHLIDILSRNVENWWTYYDLPCVVYTSRPVLPCHSHIEILVDYILDPWFFVFRDLI